MAYSEIAEKGILATIIGGLTYLLGGWDILAKALIFVVIVDYATGMLSAIYNKNLSSRIGFKGIIKKVFIFFIVGLSVMIENVLNQPNTIHNVVIILYISNESLSILENATEVGLFIPNVIKEKLHIMSGQDGDKNEK